MSSPEAPSSETVLLRRLRTGDGDAFREVVEREGGRLLALCRRYLRDEEDARDAVQETFLAAFSALGRFEGGSRLGTWLHRIAINTCLMKLRSRRARPEESIEPLLPRFLEDGHAERDSEPWPEAHRLVEQRQLRKLTRAAIDRLPESYRTVLLLRDLDELSTAEAAKVLGISENAVKIRLHRARQALREQLDGELRPRTASSGRPA